MRVGVVLSDLAFDAALRRAVRAAGHEVVWCEPDPACAVQRCRDNRPDVLLLDLMHARRSAAALPVLSALAQEGMAVLVLMPMAEADIGRVFEATGAGACDVVPASVVDDMLIVDAAVLALRLRSVRGSMRRRARPDAEPRSVAEEGTTLVAIGASAGGPAAIVNLLNQLPTDFNGGLVLVQHVSDEFSVRMAEWLASVSRLPLHLAQENDRIERGKVLMASGAGHLKLRPDGRLAYDDAPGAAYRPSIDLFFGSVVENWRGRAIGVLLTGMGRDGAMGLARMRTRGLMTIAQDRASSAVFGMPKAAAALDAAMEVLPLDTIGKRIVELVG